MPLNPEIRDQAYQFFIEEAPELLQVIEAGILMLGSERSTATIHTLMRSAHSLKGGSASVDLDAIATLAHRLENIFKALYDESIVIDTDLESQILQAFDCLRLPLTQQIRVGYFDTEQALSIAEPIFTQLEEQLKDAIAKADSYIPSSSDLGIDMAKSIFEVDVAQGLERLEQVVANPENYEVAGELRAQAEVFAGFGELLNQVGFGAIATTTLTALFNHPDRALEITQLALTDFELARQVVLAGNTQGIGPSAALLALAGSTATNSSDFTAISTQDKSTRGAVSEHTPPETELDGSSFAALVPEDTQTSDQERQLQEIFNFYPEILDELPTTQVSEATTTSEEERQLQEIFSSFNQFLDELPSAQVLEDTQTFAEEQELEFPLTVSPEYGVDGIDTSNVADIDTDASDFPSIQDIEWVANTTKASAGGSLVPATSTSHASLKLPADDVESNDAPKNLEEALQSIEELFDNLPSIQDIPAATSHSTSVDSRATNHPDAWKAGSLVPAQSNIEETSSRDALPERLYNPPASPTPEPRNEFNPTSTRIRSDEPSPTSNLSVRVDSERLEQINNLVGELAINRNGLSLQNEQLQGSVRELLNRFARVQNMVVDLRKVSDQMLIAPQRHKDETLPPLLNQLGDLSIRADFDSLELDSYGLLHSRLQGLLEDMAQLEEAVDDIVLFARATDQKLEQQRQMLTQLRDQLMWARMLPLGEVLHRFPRMLRDLSTTYRKPVALKLSGAGVLVDKAVLEKLYDPLLHLLRNAFDHGIEPPQTRRSQGKAEQGQIEIRAYHQGSQTIIEVRDDGQGLNTERIRSRAMEMGLFSREQLATVSNNRLFELIFEPGFSTASQVSELSGRGVGLDVVRSQMRSLKGTISVSSSPGVGTTFTLRLPLTLTIAKLLVGFIGSTAVAIPSDSIEEIVIPKAEQIKHSGSQRLLHWRGQILPAYRLADLLEYSCPLPDAAASKALIAVSSPQDWALPMLVLRQQQQFIALEIERLVTEQELVIKPFGEAIAPPSCTYGCTILGDGSLIPVLDAAILVDQLLKQNTTALAITTESNLHYAMATSPQSATTKSENVSVPRTFHKTHKAPTILVVDDAAALRRTLALTLERTGCRVLQARDGREAIEQLHRTSSVDLVICDIEMPNMNGFEFLSQRRQDPQLLKIPVVMLTSRSNDKHRWLAMQLGATAYFTKPYLEQEFVGAIKDIISETTPESIPALQATQ